MKINQFALFIAFFLALSHTANGTQDILDNIQGYYSMPSIRCTKYNQATDKIVPCAKQFKDCLLIRKIDSQTANIELYSTQANQSSCAVNGTAKIVDGKLVLYFDADTGKNAQHLDFIFQNKKVLLKEHVQEGESVKNCGVHARFEGLLFKKTDNNPGKHQCFEG